MRRSMSTTSGRVARASATPASPPSRPRRRPRCPARGEQPGEARAHDRVVVDDAARGSRHTHPRARAAAGGRGRRRRGRRPARAGARARRARSPSAGRRGRSPRRRRRRSRSRRPRRSAAPRDDATGPGVAGARWPAPPGSLAERRPRSLEGSARAGPSTATSTTTPVCSVCRRATSRASASARLALCSAGGVMDEHERTRLGEVLARRRLDLGEPARRLVAVAGAERPPRRSAPAPRCW